MPRERKEFFRLSNTKEKEKVFVLAFEGNETEEKYFTDFKDNLKFNDDIISLHLLKRDKIDNNSAPNHVFKKLMKEARNEYNFGNKDELWMIIDRDRWKNIPQIIEDCKQLKNMFVAVSNPCFEFWLLLHIKNINEYTEKELQLIFTNKKVNRKKNYIDSKISEILGFYNKSNLKTDEFLPYIDNAIKQAKELDNAHEDYPTKLGSHVYKLIEKISINPSSP